MEEDKDQLYGINMMAQRLKTRGGEVQQNRMIKDKR